MKGRPIEWSSRQREVVRLNLPYMTYREVAALLNERHGMSVTAANVQTLCARIGVSRGGTGRFATGHVPHNKGVSGWSAPGTEATRFVRGGISPSTAPVGTYRQHGGRWRKMRGRRHWAPTIWRVKVGLPDKWLYLHRLVWENAHGPIPSGSSVIFVSGDSDDCRLDNLALVTRAELAWLNAHGAFGSAPPEHRRALIAMARLSTRVGSHKGTVGVITGPDGKRGTLAELAERHGRVSRHTAASRIRSGWDLDEALTTPLYGRRRSA